MRFFFKGGTMNITTIIRMVLPGLMLSTFCLAQGVSAPFTSRLKTFASGLSRPILLRNAGDGSKRIFVVQQDGQIRVFQPGASTSTVFIDLTSKILVPQSAGDERGLLGLTFHPQFATNGRFYVDYTRSGDGATIISEYRTSTGNGSSNQGDISTERIILTIPQPFANHNGGMVEFGPDGFLYIGMGDGGSANDPQNNAQNRSRLLGKVLRIDVNIPPGSAVPYLIPATNPFTGTGTARCDGGSTTAGTTCQEIWTIGMRNPWRYSFDRGTGAMWLADVGQGSVEEVDVINTGGGNYGWRVYEGTSCTNLDAAQCNPNNFVMPLFVYNHTGGRCSITGGYVYRGLQGSLPTGAYIYADYCTGEVFMRNNDISTTLHDTPRLITSFGEDEDGEIYICYSNGQIDKLVRSRASADLDGDLRTDVAVYRPSNGIWFALNSSNGSTRVQQFGVANDVPAPEDFDGDNIVDIAIFRPGDGRWWILRSSDGVMTTTQWGQNGDVPAAGDYDGDAKADQAVFRPSTGVWYVQRSRGGFAIAQFGTSGDVPVAGDYDNDGKYDIGVWRPTSGIWYRLNSSNGGVVAQQWGVNGDVAAPGDFDGDGRMDIAVFRPSNGVWYIYQSLTGTARGQQWGANNDIPTVGDYDGDGRDDIAVFRPSTGVWWINRSSSGTVAVQWGQSGDTPIPMTDSP
jgi:glucose/arabinose dehydrogenase